MSHRIATTGSAGQRGGSLVEGAVGISLIILAMIVSLLIFVEVWSLMVFKQRLGTAASEAAQLAADRATAASWNDAYAPPITIAYMQGIATTKANSVLQSQGITTACTTMLTVDGRMIVVRLTGTHRSSVSGVWFLPAPATVTEVAAAPARIIMPPGLLTITTGNMHHFTIPTYYHSQSAFPTTPVPYARFTTSWTSTGSSLTVNSITDPNWLNWSPVY